MQSLARALRRPDGERRGRPTLRLALVVSLIVVQSIQLGDSAGLLAGLHAWALPSICLSALAASLGFTAAHDRALSPWRVFATDRLRLAYPVYAFAILSTAFVLGPILTNEGYQNYLRDGRTLAYLLNLAGLPQYELPGVFEFNEVPRVVNAVVWVAPVYLALLAITCLPSRNRLMSLVPIALAIVVAIAALIAQGLDLNAVATSDLVALLVQGDGVSVILSGLLGIAFYHARERVRLRTLFSATAAVVLAGAALVGNPGWLASAPFRIVMAVPTTYLVVFLTLRRLSLPVLARRAEPYLAGLFLLVFPLQQTMMERGPEHQSALINAIASGAAALILAAAFWHFLGRRLLSQRAKSHLADARAAQIDVLLDFTRVRRVRRSAVIENLALTLVMGGIFIGIMALLYIALQPDTGV